MCLQTCASSEDSIKPAHSRSLIRVFHGRILDSQERTVSSCGQRRLLSDCVDVQADLSLRWTYISEVTFSRVTAHYVYVLGRYVLKDRRINGKDMTREYWTLGFLGTFLSHTSSLNQDRQEQMWRQKDWCKGWVSIYQINCFPLRFIINYHLNT